MMAAAPLPVGPSRRLEGFTDGAAGLGGATAVTIEKSHGLTPNRALVGGLHNFPGQLPGGVLPVGGGMHQVDLQKRRPYPVEGLPVGSNHRDNPTEKGLQKIMAPLGPSQSLPIGMSDAIGIADKAAADRLNIKYVC